MKEMEEKKRKGRERYTLQRERERESSNNETNVASRGEEVGCMNACM